MVKKKPTKTQLKKRADKYFSLWIRRRDKVCQSTRLADQGAEGCTREQNLQCAHIHTRSYSATRLDPENAVALCRSCHVFFTQRPREWRYFINTLFDDVEYYDTIGERAFLGARRLVAVDYEQEAAKWKNLWGE